MPEDQKFNKLSDLLSPDQIKTIVTNLTQFGIEEVRLTGGEPLMHPQFREILTALTKCDLKKLAITTNAILLDKEIDFLIENNVKSLNISFDSLNENSFNFITKTKTFQKVLSSILKANDLGFNIKINAVMMKNINFEEVDQFLEFSSKHNIEVRFLELMKIGQALQYYDRHFVSADQIIEKISNNWDLTKVPMPNDSTSFNYIATNGEMKAKIGFIASESKPFCGGCSRLRLSNKGVLRPCIMINEGPNISETPIEQYSAVLNELINKKPNYRIEETKIKMNEIGG
jgi:cyclic pyranopterin phosphate synthase